MKVGIVTRRKNYSKKERISEELEKVNIEMEKVSPGKANVIKDCDLLLVLNDEELKEEMIVSVGYAVGVGVPIFLAYTPLSAGLRALLNTTKKSLEIEVVGNEEESIIQKIKKFFD